MRDDDLRLVHALQIRPRASWSALARAIGSDPVTLARRWERLRARGDAWIAVYRATGMHAALLEVDCAPADAMRIAEQIAADPEVLTIDLTAGNRDLLVTLLCEGPDRIAGYVLDRVPALPRVRALRTQIITSAVSDARSWRVRALEPAEVAALEREPTSSRTVKVSRDLVATLQAVLMREPRISVAALAEEIGVPRTRAAAVLSSALATGRIVLRTEIARPLSEWPVYAWFFLRVGAREREAVVTRLATLQEARLVASTVGGYDIALAAWLRTLDDVPKLESYLTELLPQVTVADRSLVLRTPLHLRRLLDPHGRPRNRG
ncbi:Lrp/AsnC family transcriptional regulator [Pseudonocardia sp. C8]|uniref:Lrp/AsnC family transcriptional regulator n=1 Tax=Pseudonocardia sp. C8 TaxID=2762759 RepID=UPI001C92F669|nr:Lrp/AsnC family transcriptional regulator [Pseudonocardia sp. C8]